jgi:putative FmdB family regulatory protein
MPVYEYLCKACDHEFEREQRISDKPLKKCPACGSMKAKRLISRTSFILKGGGWYSDLYSSPRKDSANGANGGEPSSKSEKSEKSEPGKTSKPSSDSKSDSAKGSRAAA